MNVHKMNINWKDFKKGVRSLWNLNDSEIEASGGDTVKLENIIIDKFEHESPVIVHILMEQLIDSFDNPTDRDPNGLYQTSFERSPVINEF
ncbi:MAG: hypothetical protein WDA09_05140 [Bacteriovoracaceae bacterium]